MNNLFTFLVFVLGGVIIEFCLLKIYRHLFKQNVKTYHFSIGRYIFLLLFPLLGVLALGFKLGYASVFKVFILFAFLGTFFEYFIGFAYHQIVGQRLWTYHRFDMNGYSSILSIPIWGLAGILFWTVLNTN